MPGRSDFQDAIVRLKKLKALQAEATDKLNRIGKDAGRKPKKKTTKPAAKKAVKKKARTPAGKASFWQRLFGKKRRKR